LKLPCSIIVLPELEKPIVSFSRTRELFYNICYALRNDESLLLIGENINYFLCVYAEHENDKSFHMKRKRKNPNNLLPYRKQQHDLEKKF
jgi:hypothetical protein